MNIRRTVESGDGSCWDWYWGVRYSPVKDTLAFLARGGFLDESCWNTQAKNDIVGPQADVRWNRSSGYVAFSVEGGFLAGAHLQRAKQAGYIATDAEPVGQNQPLRLVPCGFTHTPTNETFVPVGELRVETVNKVNPWCVFRVGCPGLVSGGSRRAGGQVVYRLPSFGLTDAESSEVLFWSCSATPRTLGLELNR